MFQNTGAVASGLFFLIQTRGADLITTILKNMHSNDTTRQLTTLQYVHDKLTQF